MSEAFTILGRIQLRIAGRFQDLGGRRLPAILGTLLAHPGRSLSYGTLIEWAWGPNEELPQHRDSTFHTYAKRIRNVLKEMDVQWDLPVQNGSLRIDVDRTLIDFNRMSDLIKQARTISDPWHAKDLLEQAAELWAGPPLAELESERARKWRQTIVDHVWLPANRELIGHQITLGELDAAMARLDELQAEYPTNLGLAKRRLEVLRKLGRHLDFTEAYIGLRKQFRDDADDESAEELRRYHDTLRSTDAPVAAPKPDAPAAPVQLPHASPDFAGRTELLAELDASAASSSGRPQPAVFALTGPAGVGKTSAAVYWARRWLENHPHDGALLVDLHGFDHGPPVEPSHMVDELLHCLGFPVDRITGYAGRAAKLRDLLARSRPIVLLDNARDSKQVIPILPLLASCLVVVTSRQVLTALGEHGARSFPVEPLHRKESADVLTRRIGERADRDPTSVAELAALCGGLPLALHIVANHIAPQHGIRLADYARHLRDATPLSLGSDGDSSATTLAAAFTASYRALPDADRRLFRLLGLHPGPDIGVATIAALAGERVETVVPALDRLVGLHLIERSAVYRYRVHDLIRAFAARLVAADEPSAGRTAAELRMLDFYLHTAHRADQIASYGTTAPIPRTPPTVTPLTFPDDRSAITWCRCERRNLVAATRYAAEHGHHDHACLLPHVTLGLFRRYGYFDDARTMLDIAIGAARNADNVEAEGASLADLGHIHLTLGELQEARKQFQLGRFIAQKHGFVEGIATSHCNSALVQMLDGDYDGAIRWCQEALEVAQRHGLERTRSTAYHRLGDAYGAKRQYELAATHYQDALSLRQRIGYQRGEGQTLTQLASLYLAQGDYATAAAYGQRALEVIDRISDVETGQRVCALLAEVALRRRDARQAARFGVRALALARRVHNAEREAAALDLLAQGRLAEGHVDMAVARFRQALDLYADLGRAHHVQRLTLRLHDLAAPDIELPTVRTDSPRCATETPC